MAVLQQFVIFGTESTGKTTLAKALGARLACPVVDEYVRGFWHEVNGTITARHLTRVAAGQIEGGAVARAAAARGDSACVIHDTDLLTHVLWADLLFPGQCRPWVREAADLQARAVTCYLFCDAAIDWQPDPQRVFAEPGERARVQDYFRQALETRGLPYIDIRGSHDARLAQALAAIRTTS